MEELLKLPRVEAATGESRSTIYEKIRKGEFPEPVQIGARAVAWRKSEIEAYIAQQIEKGRAAWQAKQRGKPVAAGQKGGAA